MTTQTIHSIRGITSALETGSRRAIESLRSELLANAEAQSVSSYSIALDTWNEKALTVVLKTAADDLSYDTETTDQHTILTFPIGQLVELIIRLVTCEGVPLPSQFDKFKTPTVELRLISDMHALASGICCMFDVLLTA